MLQSEVEAEVDDTGSRFELHKLIIDLSDLKAVELRILDRRFESNSADEVSTEDYLPTTMFEPPCRVLNKISCKYSDSYAIGTSFPDGSVVVTAEKKKFFFGED